jgi:CobQ-like glutamine amidotransferase family enzyme
MMRELNICHLYPDLLNLYGDRGNIIALKKRCEWRGIDARVTGVTMGEAFEPDRYDIVFLGGGQDYEQQIIQDDVINGKGSAIKSAIGSGTVFLCVCGGYQLLGKYYRTWDGTEIEFLGALNLWTIGGKKRMIGNIVVECDFLKPYDEIGRIVGFENHSGRTFLGDGVEPLGKILRGNGNNGEDGGEGAICRNVFCTYSHGSVLPKNPAFADHLLSLALRRKYGEAAELAPLDNRIENLAHESMIKRIIHK